MRRHLAVAWEDCPEADDDRRWRDGAGSHHLRNGADPSLLVPAPTRVAIQMGGISPQVQERARPACDQAPYRPRVSVSGGHDRRMACTPTSASACKKPGMKVPAARIPLR